MVDVVACEKSPVDGTVKVGLRLSDGQVVETVSVAFEGFHSVCLSTQVGCGLNCSFCGSGIGGFSRNLKASEIVAQLEAALEYSDAKRDRTEASFMGIGEPLLNLDEVFDAVETMQTRSLARQFGMSTVGVVSKLYELTRRMPIFILQLSLHAPNDGLRSQIVPINKQQPIKEILEATRMYAEISQCAVYVNYVLIDGINDSIGHASELADLLEGSPLRLRISKLNPIDEVAMNASSPEKTRLFEKACIDRGLHVVRFASKGTNRLSGCGQLRSRFVK